MGFKPVSQRMGPSWAQGCHASVSRIRHLLCGVKSTGEGSGDYPEKSEVAEIRGATSEVDIVMVEDDKEADQIIGEKNGAGVTRERQEKGPHKGKFVIYVRGSYWKKHTGYSVRFFILLHELRHVAITIRECKDRRHHGGHGSVSLWNFQVRLYKIARAMWKKSKKGPIHDLKAKDMNAIIAYVNTFKPKKKKRK